MLLAVVILSMSLVSVAALEGGVVVGNAVNSGSNTEVNSGSSVHIGGDVTVNSNLAVNVESGTTIVTLSNGTQLRIVIGSDEARNSAEAYLEVNDCSDCEVELKERSVNGEAHAVYTVTTTKQARVLGIFSTSMDVSADVDAQTGVVVGTRKPWWSFMAVQSDTNASASAQ